MVQQRSDTCSGVSLGTMHRLVASSFGLGLIPRRLWGSDNGAGTFGAALAAVVGCLLVAVDAPWWIVGLLALVSTVASIWSARPFAADGDPGWICMDETAGTFVAMIGLGGIPWVVAVVVARLADIFKVLPGVTHADGMHGPLGITLDDVIAGLYGLAVGWGLVALGV
jgi:phosphatidylglycerophosphatase A